MVPQRVLVTAGASGIGREIALAFVAVGAEVLVVDLNADGLANLAQESSDIKTAVDMSKRADIERVVPRRSAHSAP